MKKRWKNERGPEPGRSGRSDAGAAGRAHSRDGAAAPAKPGVSDSAAGAGKPVHAPSRRAGGKRQAAPRQTHDGPPKQAHALKTLDRVLSKLGVCSRTESREWIQAGRVQVNGRAVRDPEHWVDMDRDRVSLDGKPVRAEQKTYLLLNKPKGYLTSYTDPEGRKTVYDLLKPVDQWVFPVGRLDLDTSGLLLLTNDSQLAEHITNPDSHVAKTYLVKSSQLLTDDQLRQLRDGVELKDGMTRPAQVRRVRDSERYTFLEITITEGRNRQVRRMIEALGAVVLKLVRVSIGPLRLGTLQMGAFRTLTPDEVRILMNAGRRHHAR